LGGLASVTVLFTIPLSRVPAYVAGWHALRHEEGVREFNVCHCLRKARLTFDLHKSTACRRAWCGHKAASSVTLGQTSKPFYGKQWHTRMNEPILTRDQVRRLDQLAVTEFGMSGLVLMENAGRGTTDVICGLGIDGPVVICCGRGNNAGDGFVIVRHLDLRGNAARVVLWSDPDELTGDAATNFSILRKTEVPVEVFSRVHEPERFDRALAGADWIVDALLGTGARGEPRPPLDVVIDQINAAPARRLAVDLPSGLDCDTGRPAAHTVRAEHTCTFAAVKPGLLRPEAVPYVGQLHLVDIGTPRTLIERLVAEA